MFTAENYLGTTVKNAVVTVPAYFNDSQRQVCWTVSIFGIAFAFSYMQLVFFFIQPAYLSYLNYILGTNSLNSGDVPLSKKQTNITSILR